MNRNFFRVVSVLLLVMLLGVNVHAKSNLMAKVEGTVAPKPDQALMIFMRSSFVGSLISASIFDVTGDETKFVGIMYNGTKVSYDIDPGEYTFMVAGEGADFLKVTAVAGKTYYALITPRPGAWKARFSFRPLRQIDLASKDFAKWNSKTYFVTNTPESEAWAAEHAESIILKRSKYWPEWLELSPEEQNTMTLNSEDGI